MEHVISSYTRTGRILPACDWCYFKKSRCDRQRPCQNCVINDVECRRQRPRNSARRRAAARDEQSRISEVIHRMSRLEETIKMQGSSAHQAGVTSDSHRDGGLAELSPLDLDGDTQPQSAGSTRERENNRFSLPIQHAATSSPPPTPYRSATNNRQTSKRGFHDTIAEEERIASMELGRYLRVLPQTRGCFRVERFQVLHSTMEKAKLLALSALRDYCTTQRALPRTNFYNPTMYPSLEMLHLGFHGNLTSPSAIYFLDFYTSLSQEDAERMLLSLIDCTVHGQTRVQYVLCTNYVIYACLTALESKQSPTMRQRLGELRETLQQNVFTALEELDTQAESTPALFHALHSGAMLMQVNGQSERCWELNRAAYRVGTDLLGPSGEQVAEDYPTLQITLIKCYVFDVALSSSLYRSATTMPPTGSMNGILDLEKPSHAMFSVLLQCTEVHEMIMQVSSLHLARNNPEPLDQGVFELLKAKMGFIWTIMNHLRPRPEYSEQNYNFILYEWLCMDLWFYATMTSIMAATSHRDQTTHQHCLRNARKALGVLGEVLAIASQPSPATNKYLTTLSWFIPLFPLHPLYLIFSNVIVTSDTADRILIEDTAAKIGWLSDTYTHFAEFGRICNGLVKLYTEFLGSSLVRPPRPTAAEVSMTGDEVFRVRDSFTDILDGGRHGLGHGGEQQHSDPSVQGSSADGSVQDPFLMVSPPSDLESTSNTLGSGSGVEGMDGLLGVDIFDCLDIEL